MLRGAAPFKKLPPEAMRWLAAHLQRAQAGPGEALASPDLREACYWPDGAAAGSASRASANWMSLEVIPPWLCE